MSQERIKGELVFHCDGDGEDECDEFLETDERDFSDANQVRDAEGWKAVKVGDAWLHRCHDCSRSWARHQHAARTGERDDD